MADAIDKDKQVERAKSEFGTNEPTGEQVKKASIKLLNVANSSISCSDRQTGC